ncbi:hypothetical protein [Azospirillum picis]|uniref:Uncharacterized protein n=1 Tax=Azospirillum picis TaxID=488438 RepID=A0ABU0MPH0_9PROT|nr:hypothetical protein [Azospirillum picis]MBP2301535.1 hypothetical protein [Azospirillum picis]MDQ0535367.1 hypothetical protein [Azospirillum picis]
MGAANHSKFDPQQAQSEIRAAHEETMQSLNAANHRAAETLRSRTRPVASAPASRNATSGGGDDGTGFVMGLATGVPVPLTPSSIAGSVAHHSIYDSSSSCSSPSYDSGSSGSDSGSPSSSSCE